VEEHAPGWGGVDALIEHSQPTPRPSRVSARSMRLRTAIQESASNPCLLHKATTPALSVINLLMYQTGENTHLFGMSNEQLGICDELNESQTSGPEQCDPEHAGNGCAHRTIPQLGKTDPRKD